MDSSWIIFLVVFTIIAGLVYRDFISPAVEVSRLRRNAVRYLEESPYAGAADMMEESLKSIKYKFFPKEMKKLIDIYIFNTACVKIIKKYAKPLARKRKISLFRDDYGRQIKNKWEKEQRYFIVNLLIPELKKEALRNPGLSLEKGIGYFLGVTHFGEDDGGFSFNNYCEFIEVVLDEYEELESINYSDNKAEFEGSGHDYEHFVADLLRNAGLAAEVTKGSGDHGADILAEMGDENIVIQCKFYSSLVGNKAVQEAYSAQGFYDAKQAWVVTNLGYTQAAKIAAKKLGVVLLTHDEIPDVVANITIN